MVNYGKKFYLILTFLSVLPSLHAMENSSADEKKRANSALRNAIIIAQNNNFADQQDWNKIQNCLDQGADLNYKTGSLRKPLLALVIQHADKNKEMSSKLLDYLLEKGADPDCRDNNGSTPLFYTLSNPLKFDREIVKTLLHYNANPNAKSMFNETPLAVATAQGNNPMVELLIQYQANVNQKNHTGTPLHFSMINRFPETTTILLNARASLFNISENGTAFHAAMQDNLPLGHIEKLITNARFDSYPEIIDPEYDTLIKKVIITSGCIFKKFGLPIEVHYRIVSMLPPNYFRNINSGDKLPKLLQEQGYDHPYLCAQVHHRTAWLIAILKTKDRDNELASSYWHFNSAPNLPEIISLVKGQKLQKDFNAFNENFPKILYREEGKTNLICQMYHHCAELLDQQNKV